MNFNAIFAPIKTMDDLKKAYRRLAVKCHPDCPGGSEAAMKALNNAYDEAVARIARTEHRAASSGAREYDAAASAYEATAWRDTLLALLHLAGLEVELCGRWLWITGTTYQHRATLKALGCRWSGTKKAWYWHAPDDGGAYSRRQVDMATIRAKYGSQMYSAQSGAIVTV